MTAIATSPFPIYLDVDGSALENGYLYFGVAGQNPETNPITVYWDSTFQTPAAQPIRTSGGYAVRNGSPAMVYFSATDYSITVRDKNRRLVYSKLSTDNAAAQQLELPVADVFTGNGATTVYTLSKTPSGQASLHVSIGGVTQTPGVDYTLTNGSKILTFTSAPPSGTTIVVLYGQSSEALSQISYTIQASTATAGQTVFNLTNQYTPGANTLGVYLNGLRLTVVSDYAETSTSSITLTAGAVAGDELLFVTGTTEINPVSITASAVAYTPAGTGAVATDVQTKLRQTVSVSDFGADSTGVVDATAAIQNAVNAGYLVEFQPYGSYKVSGAITLRSGQTIIGNQATITQTATRTQIFTVSNLSNIKITGVKFVGVGTDFNNSPSSRATAIFGNTVSNIDVYNNTFTNFSQSSMDLQAATDVSFHSNTVVGPGSPTLTPSTSGACYGVLVEQACQRVAIFNNSISQHAQGVYVGLGCSNVTVTGNNIFNIVGQHGMYCDAGLTNLTISGNTINTVSLIGIKVQNYDTPALSMRNISITGNTILNATGGDGISVLSTTAGATYRLEGVTVTGNVIRNAGQEGISLGMISYGTVSGNTIHTAARDGIRFLECVGVNITENAIYNVSQNGVRETTASTNCQIANNTIIDCARGAVASQKVGIKIAAGSGHIIDANTIKDSTATSQYGIHIEGGTQTSMVVRNNICTGSSDTGFRGKNPVEALLICSGNLFSGGLGDTLYFPVTNQRGDRGRIFYSTAVPSTGTWQVGDYVRNNSPAVGQPKGWYCTVAGIPGTWVSEGNL